MPDIVLATLNARYAHAAFGLRYLMANLGELQSRAGIAEFDVSQRSVDILESILALNPKIVGLGVYIWNASQTTQLAADLKRLRPDVFLVLGGPEISHETQQQEISRHADCIITGEADLTFAQVCRQVLGGERPGEKVVAGELPEASRLALPYDLYTEQDIAHRVVYVEASRGCPFKCEFCLSSLDVPLRSVPLEAFLNAMQRLLDRGLLQFKFVDRTFNLNINTSKAILQFFLDRYREGLFLHFEMIPDRLPEALREMIKKFPAGSLQFEVGIQTFNEEVAARISRKQDNAKAEENLRFLREETGVHVHSDLIAGLPGESLEMFAAGFDRLVALRPQEIQLGILKRLRGTPIARHTEEWGMIYSPSAPYEILQNRLIDFATMQRIRRMARYWDLIVNSGNFAETAPLLWQNGSAFFGFMGFADWLHGRLGKTHSIALQNLAEMLFCHLTGDCGVDHNRVAQSIWRDYQRAGRSDRPAFLRAYIDDAAASAQAKSARSAKAPARQARHLGG